jgi:hypothetical protein
VTLREERVVLWKEISSLVVGARWQRIFNRIQRMVDLPLKESCIKRKFQVWWAGNDLCNNINIKTMAINVSCFQKILTRNDDCSPFMPIYG